MSSRRDSPRFARARSVIVALVAVVLLTLYAVNHRAELREIYDELRQALPFASQDQAVERNAWLAAGPTSIDPQELASLDIEKQHRSDDDYEREEFGDGWAGIGGGCDTRDKILDRDLVDITYEPGSDCEATRGTLHDPYTGTSIGGNLSETVQIDHIVSLADAWYSGAEQWSAEKRERFANDPDNLVAVDSSANIAKSDDSISEWYPRWEAPGETAQCRYAAQHVHVLAEYELPGTRDDYRLLKKLETDCQQRS